MDRRQYLVTASTCGIAAFAGCLGGRADRSLPATPTGSWPQNRHDEANTGNANATVPPRGNHAWTSEEFTRWKPVAADGEVYIGNVGAGSDGAPVIVALDATDGSEHWRVTLDNEVSQYTSAVLEELLVAAYGNQVVAIDRESGEQKWTATVPRDVEYGQITTIPGEALALVPHRSGLVAFNATGERLWSASFSSRINDAPAVLDGAAYFTAGSTLRKFDITDGTEDWQTNVGGVDLRHGPGPSVTTEGVVVAAGGDLAVHEPMTGEQKRRLDGYDRGAHGVAVADGTAYWLTADKLAAVTVADGAVEWRLDITAREYGLCVGQDTVVAPVSYEEFDLKTTAWPTIAAFDRESGDARWYYAIDGIDTRFTTPPILVDGAVYFTSNTINGVGALGDVSPADDSWLS